MAKKKESEKTAARNLSRRAIKPIKDVYQDLHPDTKATVAAICLIGIAIVLLLAKWHQAGPAGAFIANVVTSLFGLGYLVLPAILLCGAALLLFSERRGILKTVLFGMTLTIFASLGLLEVYGHLAGGYLGMTLGFLVIPFGRLAAGILNAIALLAGVLIATNRPLNIPARLAALTASLRSERVAVVVDEAEEEAYEEEYEEEPEEEEEIEEEEEDEIEEPEYAADGEELDDEPAPARGSRKAAANVKPAKGEVLQGLPTDYVAPPVSILTSAAEKPTTGDLRANANIIKRTLESFGIAVDMGEITVGPKVTRYALKPAEGVKLTRITTLGQDLSLALAAHPIRIEAPIPGKSLVGIEIPNKQAAMVHLGNLLQYPEFMASGPLGIPMGRDVSGEPIFASISKMPHLLIAGATGSGKSIFVHSLITSLLFKNSPATLRLALVDPKRVELSMYASLPHLALPVVTENKKALAVLRWAIQEMEQRYELFASVGSRDIASYNSKHKDSAMPNIVIVIDEMADLMATFGREVEGYIIRLAQMARATGIHLILATQRPSVDVITGLIKANITNRVALQVASLVDSRTILDASGAEKLLGGGDLLFLSPQHTQPKRIQGAFLNESEIEKVVDFVKQHNNVVAPVTDEDGSEKPAANSLDNLDTFLEDGEDEDDLLHEAVTTVGMAQKASASLLQRRLKVGYARAARLLDIMEARDLIGPGDGAKPREVFMDKIENFLEA